jgi:hypothetical protein
MLINLGWVDLNIKNIVCGTIIYNLDRGQPKLSS